MSKKINALIENLKFDIEMEFPFLSESEREDMLLDILYESDKTIAKHMQRGYRPEFKTDLSSVTSPMSKRFRHKIEYMRDRDDVRARRYAAVIQKANPEKGPFKLFKRFQNARRLNRIMGDDKNVGSPSNGGYNSSYQRRNYGKDYLVDPVLDKIDGVREKLGIDQYVGERPTRTKKLFDRYWWNH